jgi:molybdopterin molybdotransferase
MLDVEAAIELVLSTAKAKDRADWMLPESVSLPESLFRILREDVFLDADSPPFDKSIRDGFAVRFEDLSEVPVVLTIIGESRAGLGADVTLGRSQCCEIMTGAPVPAGANAVVMVENTERISATSVRVLKTSRQNEGILRRGTEGQKGERILQSGRRISATDIGLLANTGRVDVSVSK